MLMMGHVPFDDDGIAEKVYFHVPSDDDDDDLLALLLIADDRSFHIAC